MTLRLTAAAMLSVVISTLVSAQEPANNAYAITSESIGSSVWTEVKLIDLASGQVTRNVFENAKANYTLYDARSLKQITIAKNDSTSAMNDLRPFAGYSAACAFDKKKNRLYYAPLFIFFTHVQMPPVIERFNVMHALPFKKKGCKQVTAFLKGIPNIFSLNR